MIAIETPTEGKNAITDFLIDSTKAVLNSLPDDVLEKLRTYVKEPSPVTACVNTAELIYARSDELPNQLLEIGASMAIMCANFGFHAMNEEGRGLGMAKELMKKPGVNIEAEAPTEAPEPKAEFMAAPEAVEPEGLPMATKALPASAEPTDKP